MVKLSDYFQKYYSDKYKNYGHFYDDLIGLRKNHTINLLEIGIGTLNPTDSNMIFWKEMYESYYPGASLRSYRDFFVNGKIYGIDIQPDCMIENEERIKTFLFDSTNIDLCDKNLSDLSFDIINDDGSHYAVNQIKTFENLYDRLNIGGVYIMEDLAEPDEIAQYFYRTNHHYRFKINEHTGVSGLVYIFK